MFLILLTFLFVPDNNNILGHYIAGIPYLSKKQTHSTMYGLSLPQKITVTRQKKRLWIFSKMGLSKFRFSN